MSVRPFVCQPARLNGSGCCVWLVGRRSVTIAIALCWCGALGESVGAWFGVLFVWAPNGASRDGDITDHRPPEAFAPPTRVARDVTELRRNAHSCWDFATSWRGLTPLWLCASVWAGPCRFVVKGSPRNDTDRLSASTTRIAGPNPSGRQANATHNRPCSLSSVPTDHVGTTTTV